MSTVALKPKSFSLVVGAIPLAEGIQLTTGQYLVVFLETLEVRMLTEENMADIIVSGAQLYWS